MHEQAVYQEGDCASARLSDVNREFEVPRAYSPLAPALSSANAPGQSVNTASHTGARGSISSCLRQDPVHVGAEHGSLSPGHYALPRGPSPEAVQEDMGSDSDSDHSSLPSTSLLSWVSTLHASGLWFQST